MNVVADITPSLQADSEASGENSPAAVTGCPGVVNYFFSYFIDIVESNNRNRGLQL